VSRLSRQCGILNISHPYRPPRPVTRLDLIILFNKGIFSKAEANLSHRTNTDNSECYMYTSVRTRKRYVAIRGNLSAETPCTENNARPCSNDQRWRCGGTEAIGKRCRTRMIRQLSYYCAGNLERETAEIR
jgi:hypothetical protein